MGRRVIARIYNRQRCSTKSDVLVRVRAELGEHMDDFVILARSRNPDIFYSMYSDPEWAVGAMEKLLRKMGD